MATLKATIRKDKVNKDGIAVVQIAICHHQKTAYISTDIKVIADNFIGGMVVKGSNKANINAQIIEKLNIYNERLSHIENVDAKNIIQLKDSLNHERIEGYHRISKCFIAYGETLKTDGSILSYNTALKVFLVYAKDHDVNIESIDCNYINDYNKWLHDVKPFRTQQGRNKPHSWGRVREWREKHPLPNQYSENSISTYLAHLKAVINWCISEGWVSYKVHPFAKTIIHSGSRRENILTAEDFLKIKNYSTTNPRYQKCKDIFLLSFYLGGANIADMMRFNYLGNEITYERTKVSSRTNGKALVTIPLIPQAKEIADKYIDADGYLQLDKKSIRNITSDFNYCIKCIAMDLGIESLITFTSARKCFAQIGTNLGINDNYLNYLLGHSMQKSRGMMNPYSQMDKEMCSEILKAIVKASDHPDKIQEIFKNNLKNMLNGII